MYFVLWKGEAMRRIQILFCYTLCSYDDGFHVLVSRRYDNNLDFVFSSAILFY